MKIAIGYELTFEFPRPTPMMLMLHVHPTRVSDLLVPDHLTTDPFVPLSFYRDSFGNWCTRLLAPAGQLHIAAHGVVRDSGLPDVRTPDAIQHEVQDLPDDVLIYLLGSRYCETDELSDIAWRLFGHIPPGWARAQAVIDFVHNHIKFDYQQARSTRTAFQAYNEGVGVCRDFAHLGVALCRCLNIPARYCTGYISDIGEVGPFSDMDFAGWFEAYLGGAWHTFDPRNHKPRIGRILIARGRDAVDVAISNSFGSSRLTGFKVITDEIIE